MLNMRKKNMCTMIPQAKLEDAVRTLTKVCLSVSASAHGKQKAPLL